LVDTYSKYREDLTKSLINLAVYGQMDYHSVAHMTLDEHKLLMEVLEEKAAAQSGKKRQEYL
jgi:hypothetical protein